MTEPPPPPASRISRHWLRQIAFTMLLAGLVAAATGADWQAATAGLALSAASLGFFYFVFPGGLHFGLTMANTLAVYACLFEFFREANFPHAELVPSIVALAIPVVAFLLRCFLARRHVTTMIRVRRQQELTHLPRLARWLPGVAAIGTGSFAVPQYALSTAMQDVVLLAGMTAIAALVTAAQRDVILLMMDVAMVFETMAARIDRLLMPVMAFLTVYGLLVVVFACLYRIAELSVGVQFYLHGQPGALSFGDALYLSVITISTVGYGDITPNAPLARALASLEVVCGLLVLLFGFAEIMRGGGPESEHRRRLRPHSEQKDEQIADDRTQ